MANTNRRKHICTGLMAHVDSGKTTLSEALLYTSGAIRKLGKVDTNFWIPMSGSVPEELRFFPNRRN